MAEIIDADYIKQRLVGTAPDHCIRRGDDIVSLLPAATSSADGKMTAAQAEMVAFLAAGCFGGIHVHDATASQSIASGSTYTKATCFTNNDPAANCSADAANDKILLTKTGYYKVSCSISFTSGTNNVIFKAAAFLDGTEQDNCHCERKITTGTDIGSMSFVGIIDCTAENTEVDLRFAHDNGASVDIIVKYANLNVQLIGNT